VTPGAWGRAAERSPTPSPLLVALEELARPDVEHVAKCLEQLCIKEPNLSVRPHDSIERRAIDTATRLHGCRVRRKPTLLKELGETKPHHRVHGSRR
jgi:hypothetical protein